jgi:tetratricopeptide (TPR) repeat protein
MVAQWRNARSLHNPRAGAGGSLTYALAALTLLSMPMSSLRAQEKAAREAPAVSKRLCIAFLGLENQTGDAGLAHWCYGTLLLSKSLEEVKAVRVLPTGAIRYALQQVGLRTGDAIDPNRARLLGGHIEAQRVIWGRFSKRAGQWQVTVRVMNVATGAVSPELCAEAKDWFDIRDKLNGRILAELGITPTPEEDRKAQERWTRSAETIECRLRAYWSREQEKRGSESESEKLCRQALAADPNCALAWCDLAAVLATQGRLDLAEEAARRALQARPDLARAHYVLGWLPMVQAQLHPAEAASWLERAEAELRQATQLDPDDAECQVDLAQICAARGKWEEATAILEKAILLDRTSAKAHATLASFYALRRQGEAALRELQEARRYLREGPGATNDLSAIAAAYERLGRPAEALEYHERTLSLAREMGTNPSMIRLLEKQIELLKSRLTPTFIQASPPRRYTEAELDKVLQDKLTEDEQTLVGNPFSCADAMTQWAKELTHGAKTDLDKAKAIFEALATRFDPGGSSKSRTAREVFDAWQNPRVRLVCVDHALQFVALARAAGVNAFLANVTRMPDGTIAGHACAAVFAGDRALLIDPTLRWFGAPHQQYAILDDLQAAATLCFINRGMDDPKELAAYQAGSKLWPDWPTGQQALVAGLIRAGRVPEARERLAQIPEPPSEDYEAAMYWSLAAEPSLVGEDWARARECLLKSIAIWPGQSYAYFGLGRVYLQQHQLADARTAFRTCLRNGPNEWTATRARAAITQINEEIGVEVVPETAQPNSKPQ